MGIVEHEVEVRVDPAHLWRIYADPRRIPDWQTGSPVVEVTRGDGAGVGTAYTTRRGRLVGRTTIRESEPPRRLVTATEASLGLRFTVESRLDEQNGGTRLRLRVRTRWPRGLGLAGRVVERAMLGRGEAVKELARLKHLAEHEAHR